MLLTFCRAAAEYDAAVRSAVVPRGRSCYAAKLLRRAAKEVAVRRSGNTREGQGLSVAVTLVMVATLLAGVVSASGCLPVRQQTGVMADRGVSLGEAFLSGKVMRFDDLDPDRDIAGEAGGTFSSFTGGCST